MQPLTHLQVITQLMEQLTKELSIPSYESLLKALIQTQGTIYFCGVGKTSFLAMKTASSLRSLGLKSFYLNPMDASHGDLGALNHQDSVVILSYSGETNELLPIIDFVEAKGIFSCVITSNAKSYLANHTTLALILPKTKELHSYLPVPNLSSLLLLVVLELLVVDLIDSLSIQPESYYQYHPKGAIGFKTHTVSKVMLRENLPLIPQSATIDEAILAITFNKQGCVGVMEGELLVGILTDGDLRRNIHHLKSTTLTHIMTRSVITTHKDLSVDEAIHLMNDKKITALFVVASSQVIGFVSLHQLLDYKRRYTL